MRLKASVLGAVLVGAIGFATLGVRQASALTLTFEGLKDQEPILNYYNGGTGGLGSGPGTNFGIAFGSDALALISQLNGGTGNFSNAPSGDTIAFFLTGPGVVMNVPAGFSTGFSFFYSSAGLPGGVTVYDGLNGMGSVLANLNLAALPACSGLAYCNWVPVGVAFGGTAESVNFSGSANFIGFDNVTLGSDVPGTVPEPGTILLLGSGLVGLVGLTVRRRKRTA